MDGKRETFTVPAAAYAAVYARRYGAVTMAVAAAPLIAAMIAGFSDIRWWIIALMALFIVYPMVLVMAWLALTGKPSMATRLRPQCWHFMPDNDIAVDFLSFPKDEEEQTTVSTCRISTAQIVRSCRYGKRTALFLAKDAPFDFLLIPSDLVPDYIIDLK